MYKKNTLIRAISLLLVIVFSLPIGVSAATTETPLSRASNYLDSYSAYIYPAGSGRVQVCFSVIGIDYMDTLGTLTIQLYESKDNSTWTWVKSYSNGNYSSMLGYDDYYHSGYVSYQGIGGRYYKAYVCVWAGKNGSGDTRYFWTVPRQAI